MFRKLIVVISVCAGLAACGGGGGGGGTSDTTVSGIDGDWGVVGSPSGALDVSGSQRAMPPSMGALEAETA